MNGEAELKGRKLIPAWPYSTTISMCFKDYKLYKKLVPNELLYLNKAFEYKWDWLDNYVAGASKDLNQVKKEFIQLQKGKL